MDNTITSDSRVPMRGMGYLIVRASTAGGAIPLPDAFVRIWNLKADEGDTAGEDGGIRYILTTDRDGNTPRTPLPAPVREIAYRPGGIPYAYYNVDVSLPGFYPQQFTNVPVYDTVTSIQNAYLIPLPEGSIYDGREPFGDAVDERVNPAL